MIECDLMRRIRELEKTHEEGRKLLQNAKMIKDKFYSIKKISDIVFKIWGVYMIPGFINYLILGNPKNAIYNIILVLLVAIYVTLYIQMSILKRKYEKTLKEIFKMLDEE